MIHCCWNCNNCDEHFCCRDEKLHHVSDLFCERTCEEFDPRDYDGFVPFDGTNRDELFDYPDYTGCVYE